MTISMPDSAFARFFVAVHVPAGLAGAALERRS